jgi:excisionase family DNA binding protein
MDPIAVDVAHGAELLGLSRAKFAVLLAKKIIPSAKIGRSRRILVEDLKAYLERVRDEQQNS